MQPRFVVPLLLALLGVGCAPKGHPASQRRFSIFSSIINPYGIDPNTGSSAPANTVSSSLLSGTLSTAIVKNRKDFDCFNFAIVNELDCFSGQASGSDAQVVLAGTAFPLLVATQAGTITQFTARITGGQVVQLFDSLTFRFETSTNNGVSWTSIGGCTISVGGAGCTVSTVGTYAIGTWIQPTSQSVTGANKYYSGISFYMQDM